MIVCERVRTTENTSLPPPHFHSSSSLPTSTEFNQSNMTNRPYTGLNRHKSLSFTPTFTLNEVKRDLDLQDLIKLTFIKHSK